MLKGLHIENFRGFRDLKIDSLKRVNLITGQNNTGKTGVLEALAFLLNDPNPSQCHNLPNLFRINEGDTIENFWKWMIHNRDSSTNLKLRASFSNQNDFEVILQPKSKAPIDFDISLFSKCGDVGGFNCFCGTDGGGQRLLGGVQHIEHKPAIFSTKQCDPVQEAIDYNRVILKRRKKQVEGMLRQVEPRLLAIEALQVGQPTQAPTPLVYADLGLSEMIPVTQLGQGFNRLLDIYSEIVAADAQVLLIDEIENGMHYSVLPLVWKGLFLAAKEFDVQIFATTHSWECILAADEAARGQENYDLELIRLDRVKEDIKATIMDQEVLETAKEHHWEMR